MTGPYGDADGDSVDDRWDDEGGFIPFTPEPELKESIVFGKSKFEYAPFEHAPEPTPVTPENDTSLAGVEEIWIVVYEIAPGNFHHRICLGEGRADMEFGELSATYRNVETYHYQRVFDE